MTQAAAFRATFADWKLIKTRSVVQVVFEVPLEQADAAYRVLGGMPDPGAERWCAVARLNGEAPPLPRETTTGPPNPPREDRPFKQRKPVAADKKLAQQAGMCAADGAFRRFLMEDRTPENDWPATPFPNEEEAAQIIRDICTVRSRAEIVPGTEAAERWHDLHARFQVWKMAPV